LSPIVDINKRGAGDFSPDRESGGVPKILLSPMKYGGFREFGKQLAPTH
jgi:hypothetical protein